MHWSVQLTAGSRCQSFKTRPEPTKVLRWQGIGSEKTPVTRVWVHQQFRKALLLFTRSKLIAGLDEAARVHRGAWRGHRRTTSRSKCEQAAVKQRRARNMPDG